MKKEKKYLSEEEEQKKANLGYSYYGGDENCPCDWGKSRDIFLELMDETENNRGQYANTLGYIYYYGRTNNGQPEYDQALKYFSIGETYGYFESTYKLADMYLKGQGVPKDEKAAFALVSRYYNENLRKFLSGEDTCMADIALRMGKMLWDGIGCPEDKAEAFWMLTLAEYAIGRRIKNDKYFGDDDVKKAIDTAISKCRSELAAKPAKKVSFDYLPFVDTALDEGYLLDVKIEEIKNGLKFLVSPVPKIRDKKNPKILVNIPEQNYCKEVEYIVFTAPKASLSFKYRRYDLYANDLVLDSEKNQWVFILGRDIQCIATVDEWVYTLDKC